MKNLLIKLALYILDRLGVQSVFVWPGQDLAYEGRTFTIERITMDMRPGRSTLHIECQEDPPLFY